jgi:MFS family permease
VAFSVILSVSNSFILVLTEGNILAVRILLGVTEAGLYPGIVFYITRYIPTFSSLFDVHLTRDRPYSWYKRSEMGSRIALFFSSATVAGAFSQFFTAFSRETLFSHKIPKVVCFLLPFLTWTELVEDQVRMYSTIRPVLFMFSKRVAMDFHSRRVDNNCNRHSILLGYSGLPRYCDIFDRGRA